MAAVKGAEEEWEEVDRKNHYRKMVEKKQADPFGWERQQHRAKAYLQVVNKKTKTSSDVSLSRDEPVVGEGAFTSSWQSYLSSLSRAEVHVQLVDKKFEYMLPLKLTYHELSKKVKRSASSSSWRDGEEESEKIPVEIEHEHLDKYKVAKKR